MAAPDLELLHYLIDQAVHVNGPLGKTTAPGLNALLHRLTTDLYAAASGAPPADLLPDATKADLVDGKILISQLPTRDPYAIQDNAGVVAAVTAGTYANGELQAGSADYALAAGPLAAAGDRIVSPAYVHEYCRLASGALGWVRWAKSGGILPIGEIDM
ncbi:hypothetical protein GCM10027422_43290 [Hymenobacter arcticus]